MKEREKKVLKVLIKEREKFFKRVKEKENVLKERENTFFKRVKEREKKSFKRIKVEKVLRVTRKKLKKKRNNFT